MPNDKKYRSVPMPRCTSTYSTCTCTVHVHTQCVTDHVSIDGNLSAMDEENSVNSHSSWEQHSVDSDGFSPESDNESDGHDSGGSSIDDGDRDVEQFGAEPYRYEPLAVARQHGEDVDAPPAVVDHFMQDRLGNTDSTGFKYRSVLG